MKKALQIGVIVIGRNEGSHLKETFGSIPKDNTSVIYVDSGSSDNSIKIAEHAKVEVYALSPNKPFSAARAREEGVRHLLSVHSGIKYLHFLDGDCTMFPGWMESAIEYLEENADVAIVCGRLKEKKPNISVYNWLNAMQWKAASTGSITNCGGIFTVKTDSYINVGGFDSSLLTMEEEDFCERVLISEKKIIRIEKYMALHDSDFTSFSQWWKRAVWGGFGAAISYSKQDNQNKFKYLRSYMAFTTLLPISIIFLVVGILLQRWLLIIPILYLLNFGIIFYRIFKKSINSDISINNKIKFCFYTILRKFPVAIGFLHGLIKTNKQKNRPDPHSGACK